ncbi:sensor histidine kinase [Hathewaya histolytica]|uniref:sensor histidine kinase n=1 Tax=Hathewaya histolytica TaxID=1498 RepID=UPI003B6774E0
MFDLLEQFTILFMEITVYIFIWSKFLYKDHDTSIYKNFFIVLIGSIISAIDMTYFHNTYTMLFNYVLFVLLIKVFYKKSIVKSILEFFIVCFISMILQLAIIFIGNLIGFKYSSKTSYLISAILIEYIVVLIAYYLIYLRGNFKRFDLDSKILFYFLINLGLYFTVFKLIWENDREFIVDNLILFLMTILIILIVNLFIYNYIVKITEAKKTLEVQNKYTPILEDIIEETRRRQHDFKNYLNTINGIVEVCTERELKLELKRYIKSLGTLNKSIEDITYIDNVIIKSLIYSKLCDAERNNIKFSFNVENSVIEGYLNDCEISDILGNLLNNAFEATKCRAEKEVILNIFIEDEKHIIEVKNSGKTIKPENIVNIFKKGFSTKGENRGYGLYNVKRIIERNNGKVQLFFEEDCTVFRILFVQKTSRGFRFTKKNKA